MSNEATDEIMLFGVRVVVDSMRKCVSLNNLSQYQHPQGQIDAHASAAPDYASADESAAANLSIHASSSGGSRHRKRGVPWTEEEHKMFLVGLQKVGKGDWRGISKNYVKTRTPTQVASHAQKYYLRLTNLNRRRRRSSLFDITTDTMTTALPVKDDVAESQDKALPTPERNHGFHAMEIQQPMENLSIEQGSDHSANLVHQAHMDGVPNTELDLNMAPMSSDSHALSLGLSLSYDHSHSNQQARNSGYQAMRGFVNRDSFIAVV